MATLEHSLQLPEEHTSGLTESELLVSRRMRANGWTALRSGWPDFLFCRKLFGSVTQVLPVEVKAAAAKERSLPSLRPAQVVMHQYLASLGLPASLIVTPRAHEVGSLMYKDISVGSVAGRLVLLLPRDLCLEHVTELVSVLRILCAELLSSRLRKTLSSGSLVVDLEDIIDVLRGRRATQNSTSRSGGRNG